MVSPVYHKLKKSRMLSYDLGHCALQTIDKKCKFNVLPGKSKTSRSKKESEYGKQLKMKQMLRFYYGVSEKQFVNLYTEADRRQGSTATNLLLLLESRLDNLVYRMGFASTRPEARQMVSHGHFIVDGKKIKIPSYRVLLGSKVELIEKSKQMSKIASAIEISKQRPSFDWLNIDHDAFFGCYTSYPTLEQLPPEFKPNLVIELYSK
jgi:small subunit ribosomal protein S4